MYKIKGIRIDTFVAVKKLKVIFSISMIAVLLFSSMGFTVNRHYCMGMLMDESFYAWSDACGMDAEDSCEKPGESIDMGCCDDESLVFNGVEVISFIKKQLELAPSFLAFLPNNISPSDFQTSLYEELSFFPPPEPLPYGRDLLVQVQRFLI